MAPAKSISNLRLTNCLRQPARAGGTTGSPGADSGAETRTNTSPPPAAVRSGCMGSRQWLWHVYDQE